MFIAYRNLALINCNVRDSSYFYFDVKKQYRIEIPVFHWSIHLLYSIELEIDGSDILDTFKVNKVVLFVDHDSRTFLPFSIIS